MGEYGLLTKFVERGADILNSDSRGVNTRDSPLLIDDCYIRARQLLQIGGDRETMRAFADRPEFSAPKLHVLVTYTRQVRHEHALRERLPKSCTTIAF
jgi:hypothetical protein